MGLYKKFDDAVMYAVNKGVKAWNWTTGGTKTSLANGMLSVAPVLESTGIFMTGGLYGGIGIGLIGSFVYVTISHFDQKTNIKQEKEEIKALEDGLKLPDSKYNSNNKKWGCIFNVWGVYLTATYSTFGRNNESIADEGMLTLGLGQAVRGTSHYVMRAENFPPRKNVLSRTADKIREKLAERKLQPSPNPSYGLERLVRYE